jgi:hypothetical protein
MREGQAKKNSKLWKRILITVLAALFLVIAAAVGFVAWWASDNPQDYSTDAAFIVETVEAVHPIFIVEDMLPAYYNDYRAEYLAATAQPLTRAEFNLDTRRYFSALLDGHMSSQFDYRYWGNIKLPLILDPTLDTRFAAQNSRLFLEQEPATEVLAIGGVPVAEVLYQVDRHFYSENDSDRLHKYAGQARAKTVLQRAGAQIYARWGHTYADLTLSNNGEISTRPVRFINTATVLQRYFLPGQAQPSYIIRHEMMGEVFYISLRVFVDGDHITEVADAIEQAVASGTRKFVVDLRGNGGGNSEAGRRLLAAMGITTPNFGGTRRVSDLAQEQRGNPEYWDIESLDELAGQPSIHYAPDAQCAANPQNVFVSVLTDTMSYSSSRMMATWVQDGGLGNIIGEPSSNSPSSFGDMLSATLPKSKLVCTVSYTRWLRPDANADQDTLWPDIMVPADDALDVALEYLRNLQQP